MLVIKIDSTEIEIEDDGEDLSDVKLYSYKEDSAQYVYNLRKENKK